MAIFSAVAQDIDTIRTGQPGLTLERFELPDASLLSQVHTISIPQQEEACVTMPMSLNEFKLQPQPFFCRIESGIERKSKFAPRFRLGSLDYVNWLEGKTRWRE